MSLHIGALGEYLLVISIRNEQRKKLGLRFRDDNSPKIPKNIQ